MAYLGNGPGVASQRITDTFSVSTSTSTFTPSAGYTVGYLDVYHNGVKLVNGDDYTASNGSTFVLTSAANDGDTVECVAYIPRGLSDGYTKAEADSRYLPIDAVTLPSQTGNSGKYLTTDGTNASWATVTMPDEIRDPINTSPANGSTNLGNGGFSLVSSAFKSLYGETHVASQWQISTSLSFSTTVVSTGDSASLTSYTVGAVLSTNTTYYWRVRYKDSNGTYSDWSAATTFVTATQFAYSVDYLVVAGGGAGAGGGLSGGAGGAGGMLTATGITINGGSVYSIVVGAGGSANGTQGTSGSTSSAISLSCVGGGAGGAHPSEPQNGLSGGSGGGGSQAGGAGGAGTSGQGNAGAGYIYASGGGGGGKSAAGSAQNGGAGAAWVNGTTYAGGGGAGGRSEYSIPVGTGGAGGGGGGGASSGSAPAVNGAAGTANTGGGGGGSGGNVQTTSSLGGNGGSGVVIVRYSGSQRGTGGVVTSAGGYTYHTFTSSGTFTA